MTIKKREFKDKKIQKSFVFTCVLHFLVYSLILLVLYLGISTYIQYRLTTAFPTINDVLVYEDALESDDFSKVSLKLPRVSGFIVFDNDGRTVFSSDRDLSENIHADNAEVISSFAGAYYSVYEKTDINGDPCYYISLTTQDDSTNMLRIIGSCTLDTDLNILSGDLFPERTALSQQEFEMLQGIYSHNMSIEKYEYTNGNGEYRVLVFVAPQMTAQAYDKVMNRTNGLWFMAILVIGLVILLEAFLFTRKIRRSIRPLNQAITGYAQNAVFEVDRQAIPREFQPMADNFSHLLDQLAEVQKEKDEIYRERQRMITDISHDLKTPLTVIQGYAKAFMEDMIPEDKKEKYLTAIYNRSVLATQLIDTLFEYMRMEHPGYRPDLEKMDLSKFITEILAEKYSEIESSHFQMEVDIQASKIPFKGDKKLLRRLMENLLGNALKYNPEGTTIYVRLEVKNTEAILTVADNGAGIPQDIAGQVFAPFITGSTARTSGDGTGLGLAIVRQITELHSGKISLVLPPQKPYATQFVMHFPISGS